MTPLEWLRNELWEQFRFSFSDNIFEQAKEMEVEQNKTPELSDEEIKDAGIDNWNAESQSGLFVVAFIDGAKWYREQLKQRQ